MPQHRQTRKRGGSGVGFRIPSNVVQSLRNRNRNGNSKKSNKTPQLPTKRQNLHPNLTNANLENLHVVNTSTNEWRIKPGNGREHIPKNLQPAQTAPRSLMTEMGPGVRVFTSKR